MTRDPPPICCCDLWVCFFFFIEMCIYIYTYICLYICILITNKLVGLGNSWPFTRGPAFWHSFSLFSLTHFFPWPVSSLRCRGDLQGHDAGVQRRGRLAPRCSVPVARWCPADVGPVGVQFLVGLLEKIEGDSWLRWGFFHLPGPSIFPKGHLWLTPYE